MLALKTPLGNDKSDSKIDLGNARWWNTACDRPLEELYSEQDMMWEMVFGSLFYGLPLDSL